MSNDLHFPRLECELSYRYAVIHKVIEDGQGALPMSLCSIFSSICQRLGIRASPVANPGTIIILVEGRETISEDDEGNTRRTYQPLDEPFYYDVYHKSIVRREAILDRLTLNGVLDLETAAEVLAPAIAESLMQRSARNIMNSLSKRHHPYNLAKLTNALPDIPNNTTTDIDRAWAALVALLVLAFLNDHPDNFARAICHVCESTFPYDALYLQNVLPTKLHYMSIRRIANTAQELDANMDQESYSHPADGVLAYRIGHIMQHKRYGYRGLCDC